MVQAKRWHVAALLCAVAVGVMAARFRVRIVLGPAPMGLTLPETNNVGASFDPPGTQSSGLTAQSESNLLNDLNNQLGDTGTSEGPTLIVDENGDLVLEFDVVGDNPNMTLTNLTDLELEFQDGTMVNFTDPGDPEVTPIDEDDDVIIVIVIIFAILGFYVLLAMIYACYKHRQEHAKDKKPMIPLQDVDPVSRPSKSESTRPLEIIPGSSTPPEQPAKMHEFADDTNTAKPSTTSLPGQVQEEVPVTSSARPTKERDDIADERAQYLWNSSANAVADPAPGGDVPVAKLANVVSEMPDELPKPRQDIADERAQYLWNASANAVADPAPGGDVPVAKLAEVVSGMPDELPEPPRDDIADERAKYLWNATETAVAQPAPGGDVPEPELKHLVEEVTGF